MKVQRIGIRIIILLCFILGMYLLVSVIRSGFGYQLDDDEFHHAHLVYLYTHGFVPYRDIYNSFYTPIFEWILMPAFIFFGYTLKTIAFTRFIMIVLFLIRLIALYQFVKTVWSRRVALIFLPLFLLDPFLVYSGMQIRPDNLMMTIFTVALATLACKRKYIAAFLFGLSLVVFMKALPALAIIGLVMAFEEIRTKRYAALIRMGFWFILPITLFALYGLVIGALPEMVQQLIIEPRDAYSSEVFKYPSVFGSYHRPDNVWVYGVMGKPITWIYAWFLPLLGAAGWYHVIHKMAKNASIKTILVLLLIVQYIVIFSVPSVFLQHYLQVNWLLALFGAVAIDDFLETYSSRPVIQYPILVLLFACFLILGKASVQYNIDRSGITTNPWKLKYFEGRWKQIPETEPIFPGYLFRPSVYPVPYGYYIGNVPPSIFARLPSIPDMLEKTKLKHLVLDEYTFNLLPLAAQEYISANYTRVKGDEELMTRNE